MSEPNERDEEVYALLLSTRGRVTDLAAYREEIEAKCPTSWRCTRCGATYSHPGSFTPDAPAQAREDDSFESTERLAALNGVEPYHTPSEGADWQDNEVPSGEDKRFHEVLAKARAEMGSGSDLDILYRYGYWQAVKMHTSALRRNDELRARLDSAQSSAQGEEAREMREAVNYCASLEQIIKSCDEEHLSRKALRRLLIDALAETHSFIKNTEAKS